MSYSSFDFQHLEVGCSKVFCIYKIFLFFLKLKSQKKLSYVLGGVSIGKISAFPQIFHYLKKKRILSS